MAIQKPLPIEKMVFRKTNSHLGRSLCVTPSSSTTICPTPEFAWVPAEVAT